MELGFHIWGVFREEPLRENARDLFVRVDESVWAMKGRDFGSPAAVTPGSNIP